MRNTEYELMRLKTLMRNLEINTNKLCCQCQVCPTFKNSDRCYKCVMNESSLLLNSFFNSLDLLYYFNDNMKARGKTFAKIVYSSLCWCVNVANFTNYFENTAIQKLGYLK